MHLGYNTNGFAHHHPLDALDILAKLGYQSVGLTLDQGFLNPYAPDWPVNLKVLKQRLQQHKLTSVIETGTRFLLDPWRKHQPTLLSATTAEREQRLAFLRLAIDAAQFLESDCVSFWSGTVLPEAKTSQLPELAEQWNRLESGMASLLKYAEKTSVSLAFEPEPGMFIDTMDMYQQLVERVNSPRLMLTLDVGHLHCLGELPIEDVILRWKDRLANVHIEDMRRGAHQHLMFGEGEMYFPPILAALAKIPYVGGVYVELSRHSHRAPQAAEEAFGYLSPLVAAANSG